MKVYVPFAGDRFMPETAEAFEQGRWLHVAVAITGGWFNVFGAYLISEPSAEEAEWGDKLLAATNTTIQNVWCAGVHCCC